MTFLALHDKLIETINVIIRRDMMAFIALQNYTRKICCTTCCISFWKLIKAAVKKFLKKKVSHSKNLRKLVNYPSYFVQGVIGDSSITPCFIWDVNKVRKPSKHVKTQWRSSLSSKLMQILSSAPPKTSGLIVHAKEIIWEEQFWQNSPICARIVLSLLKYYYSLLSSP